MKSFGVLSFFPPLLLKLLTSLFSLFSLSFLSLPSISNFNPPPPPQTKNTTGPLRRQRLHDPPRLPQGRHPFGRRPRDHQLPRLGKHDGGGPLGPRGGVVVAAGGPCRLREAAGVPEQAVREEEGKKEVKEGEERERVLVFLARGGRRKRGVSLGRKKKSTLFSFTLSLSAHPLLASLSFSPHPPQLNSSSFTATTPERSPSPKTASPPRERTTRPPRRPSKTPSASISSRATLLRRKRPSRTTASL